jgi:hypothetical protein
MAGRFAVSYPACWQRPISVRLRKSVETVLTPRREGAKIVDFRIAGQGTKQVLTYRRLLDRQKGIHRVANTL